MHRISIIPSKREVARQPEQLDAKSIQKHPKALIAWWDSMSAKLKKSQVFVFFVEEFQFSGPASPMLIS